MTRSSQTLQSHLHTGAERHIDHTPHIPVIALGMSLGSFLSLTFIICVLFDLWFPAFAMNPAWSPLLPGFVWISWKSLLIGLIETFAYGWYTALIFAPLFNYFARHYAALK